MCPSTSWACASSCGRTLKSQGQSSRSSSPCMRGLSRSCSPRRRPRDAHPYERRQSCPWSTFSKVGSGRQREDLEVCTCVMPMRALCREPCHARKRHGLGMQAGSQPHLCLPAAALPVLMACSPGNFRPRCGPPHNHDSVPPLQQPCSDPFWCLLTSLDQSSSPSPHPTAAARKLGPATPEHTCDTTPAAKTK